MEGFNTRGEFLQDKIRLDFVELVAANAFTGNYDMQVSNNIKDHAQ